MFRAERAGGHIGRGQKGTQAEMTRVEWHRPEIGGAGAGALRAPDEALYGAEDRTLRCVYTTSTFSQKELHWGSRMVHTPLIPPGAEAGRSL